MKWNRKFNYPTSTRALYNGKRLYDVNNEKLPSVTTILAATKPQEEIDSLNRWREKVGHKQADIISREATERGSSMHDYIEKFLLGKLNLDLLGDNTRERMMLVLQIVLVFMKIIKVLLISNNRINHENMNGILRIICNWVLIRLLITLSMEPI